MTIISLPVSIITKIAIKKNFFKNFFTILFNLFMVPSFFWIYLINLNLINFLGRNGLNSILQFVIVDFHQIHLKM